MIYRYNSEIFQKILKSFFSAIITTRFYQSAGEARNVRISEKYSWLS